MFWDNYFFMLFMEIVYILVQRIRCFVDTKTKTILVHNIKQFYNKKKDFETEKFDIAVCILFLFHTSSYLMFTTYRLCI